MYNMNSTIVGCLWLWLGSASVAYVLITAAGTDTLHWEYIDICALFSIYSERYINTAGDGCSHGFIVSLRGTHVTDDITYYGGVIYTMHILMNKMTGSLCLLCKQKISE